MAKPRRRATNLGETTYREGALDRLAEARVLLEQQHFAGSIYLAGRSVEAMLRSVLWKSDPLYQTGEKSLETGHDLRNLLTAIRSLGLLRGGGQDQLETRVQQVARLWFNNMRFASSKLVETQWRKIGEIGHGRRTFKLAARDFYGACYTIVKRCQLL